MSNDKIKILLRKLGDEIQGAQVDDETRSLLKTLESDIEDLLDTTTESSDATSVLDRAQELETAFAARHPEAERYIREIMDVLAKIGV
jgi:uncharacterized protein with von Willebrand factor type A (vWA) domain